MEDKDKSDKADRHDTEVGIPHPLANRGGVRNHPLSNTMPISRKTIYSRPKVSNKVVLEIHGLEEGVKAIELGDQIVTIGRSPECEVHLPLANISRQHAQVVFRKDEYYLEDMDSTNGTYLNGVRVKKCVLRNNDQIEIGEARIHYLEEKTVGKP